MICERCNSNELSGQDYCDACVLKQDLENAIADGFMTYAQAQKMLDEKFTGEEL